MGELLERIERGAVVEAEDEWQAIVNLYRIRSVCAELADELAKANAPELWARAGVSA